MIIREARKSKRLYVLDSFCNWKRISSNVKHIDLKYLFETNNHVYYEVENNVKII